MTERRVISLAPGETLVVTTSPEIPLSEQQKRARIEAIARARDFFHSHAEEVGYLLGGRVEDMDSLQMDGYKDLGSIAQDLMDAGVGVEEVVKDVQASLIAQAGRSDKTRLSDIARAYGGVLNGTILRIQEERSLQTETSTSS